MMIYKRKIAYFNILENEIPKGNGGFCKWVQKKDSDMLFVSLRNLPQTTYEKVVLQEEKIGYLGEIFIQRGQGGAVIDLKEANASYEGVLGKLSVSLSSFRELKAEFPASQSLERKNQTQEQGVFKAADTEPEDNIKNCREEQLPEENTNSLQEGEHFENRKKDGRLDRIFVQNQVVPIAESMGVQPQKTPSNLQEMLSISHNKMRPFGTEKECFCIALEDIFLLKKEYHVLLSNPFLLHGYYNYHYLILGEKDNDTNEFWLGVPGIYHEREKMAARMYGFEKFEGAKQEYTEGDLGYYLISAM